jgi:hypothetical protein
MMERALGDSKILGWRMHVVEDKFVMSRIITLKTHLEEFSSVKDNGVLKLFTTVRASIETFLRAQAAGATPAPVPAQTASAPRGASSSLMALAADSPARRDMPPPPVARPPQTAPRTGSMKRPADVVPAGSPSAKHAAAHRPPEPAAGSATADTAAAAAALAAGSGVAPAGAPSATHAATQRPPAAGSATAVAAIPREAPPDETAAGVSSAAQSDALDAALAGVIDADAPDGGHSPAAPVAPVLSLFAADGDKTCRGGDADDDKKDRGGDDADDDKKADHGAGDADDDKKDPTATDEDDDAGAVE